MKPIRDIGKVTLWQSQSEWCEKRIKNECAELIKNPYLVFNKEWREKSFMRKILIVGDDNIIKQKEK